MYDNKSKIIGILILAAVIFSMFTIYIYSADSPTVSARSAVLYIPETDEFIYTKNENARLSPASTTKIMTAAIALEVLDGDKIIETDERAVGVEGSSIYLTKGEALTARDLVYALILQSANDAAESLAYAISGSIEGFASLMNEKAAELGLLDTSFKNPHGLDSEGHYTSAHDLALITAYAFKNPIFREIASTYKKEIESSEKTRLVVNHNKLLKSYAGCIGVKTGYTKKSGRSLVSAAERDGLTLIAVTINAPDDWRDHREMLDYGFSRFKKYKIINTEEFSKEIPVIGGEKDCVRLTNTQAFQPILPKETTDIETHIKLSRYLTAPIKAGECVGEIIITNNGKPIGRVHIVSAESVNSAEKRGFFSLFKR